MGAEPVAGQSGVCGKKDRSAGEVAGDLVIGQPSELPPSGLAPFEHTRLDVVVFDRAGLRGCLLYT
jgi:hypothetical protein